MNKTTITLNPDELKIMRAIAGKRKALIPATPRTEGILSGLVCKGAVALTASRFEKRAYLTDVGRTALAKAESEAAP